MASEGTQQKWDEMLDGTDKLEKCVSEIREQIKIGMDVVSNLQSSWNDNAQEEFVDEMSQKANEVEDLMQLFEQYAKALEDYVAQSRSDVEAGTQRIRNIG